MVVVDKEVATTVICRLHGSDAKNFTDGKRYRAFKQGPGLPDGPCRTWHVLDDHGHDRVILIGVPSAHLKSGTANGFKDEVVGVFEQA